MSRSAIEKRLVKAEQQVEFYQRRLGLDVTLLRKWQRRASALSKKIAAQQEQQLIAARAELKARDSIKGKALRAINLQPEREAL